MRIAHLSVLGVGLLGGSLGLAAKSRLSGCRVTGYGRHAHALGQAVAMGAIDQTAADVADAVRQADCIVLCTPVRTFETLLADIAPHLKPGAIVTDVGSTKRSVVALAERILPPGVHFVGGHPMAGSEKRGIESARPDLFKGSVCILTPTASTNEQALRVIENLWQGVGMRIARMTPHQHDQRVAMVSHLPHAIAAALMAIQDDQTLALHGRGFADVTRIAAGDPSVWRDIFLDNADELRSGINLLRDKLDQFESLLHPDREAELKAWLETIAQKRLALP